MKPIITRAEARARGLTRYFTGEPCVHGHYAERRVSNGECCTCHHSVKRANGDYIAAEKSFRNLRRRGYADALVPGVTPKDVLPFYAEARRRSRMGRTRYEVDHVIPLAKGGLHEPGNLQVISRRANIAKGDKL